MFCSHAPSKSATYSVIAADCRCKIFSLHRRLVVDGLDHKDSTTSVRLPDHVSIMGLSDGSKFVWLG